MGDLRRENQRRPTKAACDLFRGCSISYGNQVSVYSIMRPRITTYGRCGSNSDLRRVPCGRPNKEPPFPSAEKYEDFSFHGRLSVWRPPVHHGIWHRIPPRPVLDFSARCGSPHMRDPHGHPEAPSVARLRKGRQDTGPPDISPVSKRTSWWFKHP